MHCNLAFSEHIVFITVCPVYYLCLWQIHQIICIGKVPGGLYSSSSCSELGQHWLCTSLLRVLSTPSRTEIPQLLWPPVPIPNYSQGSVSRISSPDSLSSMKGMAVFSVSPTLALDGFCQPPKGFSFPQPLLTACMLQCWPSWWPQEDFPKLLNIFLILGEPQDWRHNSSCGWKSWGRGIMTFLDQVPHTLVVAAFGSWHPSLLLGLTCCQVPTWIPGPWPVFVQMWS